MSADMNGLDATTLQLQTDVLIIGGGVAGMMAAAGAIRNGVTPMIVTKGTYGSGSSSMARGGHSVAIGHSSPEDNPIEFALDTIRGGYGLNNPRLVEVMCAESIDRTLELDEWGLGLVRLPDGRYDQKRGAFPQRYARLVHCGRLMGKPLMAALTRKTKEWGIDPLEHVMLVDLLKDGERVVGAWGFKYRDGLPVVIHARSTVMATGGAPQLHALNDSPPTITGDGYAMAWRAGAELIDMEFIDYQLITAAPAKLAGYPPHSSAFIAAGGYLLNREHERFMARYEPERMEKTTRALINRAVAREIFEGRGTEHHAVYVDVRHVFEQANAGASADVIKTFRNSGVDLSTSLLEVTSCPHTYLGGIRIDEWGRTNLQGLYAGGEAAGGVHGANRLGGAALIDSYVFGFRAGAAAACEARAREQPRATAGNWQEALHQASAWLEQKHGEIEPEHWRSQVQDLVVSSVGQVRRGDRLTAALAALDELESAFSQLKVGGETTRKRFESMCRSLETRNLVQVARLLGTAALQREESRGGHFRLDFPEQDDTRFRGNFVLGNAAGRVTVELRPVPDGSKSDAPPGIALTGGPLARSPAATEA